jgi:hypothetical protein
MFRFELVIDIEIVVILIIKKPFKLMLQLSILNDLMYPSITVTNPLNLTKFPIYVAKKSIYVMFKVLLIYKNLRALTPDSPATQSPLSNL